MNSLSIHRVALVALLAAISLLALRTCNNRQATLNEVRQVVRLQHDTIVRWKDVAGREHAKIGVEIAGIDIIKSIHQKEIDSLLGLLKISQKQIQGTVFAGTKTSGTVKPVIDTFFEENKIGYTLRYNDDWLTIEGDLKAPQIKYTYRDSLVFTTLKNGNFFNINAYSLNPNTVFTGLKSFEIPMPKNKKFGIGAYVGYGYTGTGWQPSIGIGFQYNLIQF